MSTVSSNNRFAPKLVNGATAGTVGVTATFPLDLAKTRLQNQRVLRGRQRMYKNVFDCLWKVVKSEGPRGAYRGWGVTVLLVNPEKAVKLSVNDQLRQSFGGKSRVLPIHLELFAGGTAGFFQAMVTAPMEMLKIQLQIAGQGSKEITSGAVNGGRTVAKPPTSALEITKELIRTKGLRGMYKGFDVTLVRDIPFSMIYFSLFAYLNSKGMGPNGERPSSVHALLSGCGAGMAAAFSMTPIDVMKTRIQVLNPKPGEQTYSGMGNCAKKIFRKEGVSAFFKGAGPRMVVIAPLFGIAQMTYFIGVAEWMMGLER